VYLTYVFISQSKTKAMKEKKKKEDSSSVSELKPWPEFIEKRIVLWDKFKTEYTEKLASLPEMSIVVTLPDGKTVQASAWRSTPYDVAKGIRLVYTLQ
jgi:threonyl-tRNA synthetase